MPDIPDGESVEMQGSGAKPYILKNVGGVYSCTCPAWRNQSIGIEKRTCKHLRKYRGDAAEESRIGGELPARPVKAKSDDGDEAGSEPQLLLAESWDNVLDPAGWWMSEKLDGVRAYWDGKQFLSRQGNLYHAPDWFVAGLPNVPLDGELWLDRKAFQRAVSIVRRQDKGEQWRSIRYLIFDAPAATGPFEDRVAFLQDGIHGWKNEFTAIHDHTQCRDVDHLRAELRRIEALGGEGLMLREPASKYVAGRSTTLLKVKTFHDAEATVIRHEPGKGKHTGRLGALAVRLPNGKEFSVGTGFSDRDRAQPPPVGSLITFRYQELSDAGIPRFPSFVGLRGDVVASPVAAVSSVSVPKKELSQAQVRSIPAATASSEIRYFENTEDNASKFWEVSVLDNELTTRWGRIGTNGQSKTKSFASAAAATAERDQLIESKLAGGYSEVNP
jgi:DNA ligase-1